MLNHDPGAICTNMSTPLKSTFLNLFIKKKDKLITIGTTITYYKLSTCSDIFAEKKLS